MITLVANQRLLPNNTSAYTKYSKVSKSRRLFLLTIQIIVLAATIHLFSVVSAQGQIAPNSKILFILDASNSMSSKWESSTKIDISKRVISKIVDSLAKHSTVQIALRVYGHQRPVPPQDCSDTKLEVPFRQNNHEQIKHILSKIEPRGTTPLARSLEEAANDFPEDISRKVIILLTDGIEACDGNPCDVSADLQRRGIILEPFVVGVGLDKEFKKTFECIGKFYDAVSEVKFDEIMGIIITQVLNATTSQVNLLDKYGYPTETNVSMTFYDVTTGTVRYNYLHTLNYRGNPDTLYISPSAQYKLKIHTLPPIEVDNVEIKQGIHNIIAVDASMGYLTVKDIKGITKDPVKVIVKKKNTNETVHIQNIGDKVRYLSNDYALEILTVPSIKIDSVNIKQSHNTIIEIPKPGIVNFVNNSEGNGGIYIQTETGITQILTFPENMRFYSVTLQPGKYLAMFRPIGKQETMAVIKREFEIKQGEIIRVLLY